MSNITRLIINGFALVTAMHCGIAASGEAATITTSEQSGLRIDAQLKRFYSRVPAHHVPSGVLLEAGAIMKRDLILNNSESRQEKMAQNAFNDSYQELMKGHVFSDEKPLNLYSIGKKFTPDSVYPISLAFIDYDSIKNPKSIKSDSEGSYYKPTSRSRRTETKRFIATTVQAHLVYGTVVDFVLPQDLLLFNADTNVDIENLRFKFNDKIHEITLGEKFTINLGDEKSEPKKELTKGKISFGKGPVKEDPNTDENTG